MQVDTIDERLALFRAMMEHAGLSPDSGIVSDEELRAAAQRCLGCRAAEECHHWMPTIPPPTRCPASAATRVTSRSGWRKPSPAKRPRWKA